MNLRRLLIIIGVVSLTLLVASSFGNFNNILEAFERVRWYVLPLAAVVQAIDCVCNAKYYQSFFRISRRHIKLEPLCEISLGINFANQVIPAGGVAGTTFFTQAMSKYDVSPGNATLAQLGRYIFTFLSFFVVLALGFLMLFAGGNLNKVSVRLIILLMMIVLAIGTVLVVTISDRKRLEALAKPIVGLINAFGTKVLRRNKPAINPLQITNFVDEFSDGYREIMSHKRAWPSLFWWACGMNICEVATIYAVCISFGLWPNPGIVIAGYTLGIMASASGAIINGLGVYEAGMIGTFVALGIPFALSFAIFTVYRITTMVILIPIGLYFYRKHLEQVTT
jgi:uncharacterized protein (TIRG00374 family)